jgi:hypothetical protein
VSTEIAGEPVLVVAELGASGVQRDVPQLGNRVVGIGAGGLERFVIDAFDGDGGDSAVPLSAPHDVAVDSVGRIYVAEVGAAWLRFNFGREVAPPPVSLSRWTPVVAEQEL